jgi:hypothetical protein
MILTGPDTPVRTCAASCWCARASDSHGVSYAGSYIPSPDSCKVSNQAYQPVGAPALPVYPSCASSCAAWPLDLNDPARTRRLHVLDCCLAVMLFVSAVLLLYSAVVVPFQICMWDYSDPCNIFPTLQFDMFVDTFFLVPYMLF